MIDARPGAGRHAILKIVNRAPNATSRHNRVFNPNPVSALNGGANFTVDDVTACAYDEVALTVDAEGGKACLQNDYVHVIELVEPNPELPSIAACDDDNVAPFATDRSDSAFPAVMALYHLTEMQKHGIRIGYSSSEPMPIYVDVHGYRDNLSTAAHYERLGDDRAYIGLGSFNSIALAEDATVLAHEYGHAILTYTTDDFYMRDATPDDPDVEACAMSEGFADYWSMSTFVDVSARHRHRPDCLAEWINHGDCMRTVKEDASHDSFNAKLDEHINGQIWSSALFAILKVIGTRDVADQIILGGHLCRATNADPDARGELTMSAVATEILHKAATCGLEPDLQAVLRITFESADIFPAPHS